MGKGRKSLPIGQKELQGTLRLDRQNTGVEFELLTKVPKPEVFLTDLGKKYFKRQCQLLIDKRLLYNSDVHLMGILAEELATWETACREIKEQSSLVVTMDKGYQQQSPWLGIRNTAVKNIQSIGALFGLDPLSRQKFNIADKPKDENEFAKL